MNYDDIKKAVEQKIERPKETFSMPTLFIFFGVPGSGKTTVAKELSGRVPSVYISSDDVALTHQLDHSEQYHWTFNILNGLINKYLSLGYNVIADSNSDKYSIRKELYDIATNHDACVVCFWVQTDMAMIKRRQRFRKYKGRQKLRESGLFYVSEEEIIQYVTDLEEPIPSEETIYYIDGNKPILDQLVALKIVDKDID